MATTLVQNWKQRVKQLKVETYALYLAYKHPLTPWYAKILTACVVGYAFSPIDLIPDFIPILGYLDDLILLPLGIMLALKMIPAPVLAECRAQAQKVMDEGRPISRTAGAVIVGLWLIGAAVLLYVTLAAFDVW